jgi:hypothetical protein
LADHFLGSNSSPLEAASERKLHLDRRDRRPQVESYSRVLMLSDAGGELRSIDLCLEVIFGEGIIGGE